MARSAHEPSGAERGEVLNSEIQRRRRWTFVEKLRAAQEASAPGTSVSSVARKYGMAPSQLFRWKKLIVANDQKTEPFDDQMTVAAELRDLKQQVRELERMLGKKTLENEKLREAIAVEKSKKLDLRKQEHTS